MMVTREEQTRIYRGVDSVPQAQPGTWRHLQLEHDIQAHRLSLQKRCATRDTYFKQLRDERCGSFFAPCTHRVIAPR
jgi:hypothetical protein